jgi:hypothetical protein
MKTEFSDTYAVGNEDVRQAVVRPLREIGALIRAFKTTGLIDHLSIKIFGALGRPLISKAHMGIAPHPPLPAPWSCR